MSPSRWKSGKPEDGGLVPSLSVIMTVSRAVNDHGEAGASQTIPRNVSLDGLYMSR